MPTKELSIENLREGYARIAGAKGLWQETPRSGGAGRRSELPGVILARRSQLNLEAVAEEMQRLNTEMPATLWPDMVAVADAGLVQYSAQFPGENVTGDFFLPGETLSYAAPMYIVMVMKPSGAATLNRMLSFVVGHLALFAPGADVPKFPDIVEGMENVDHELGQEADGFLNAAVRALKTGMQGVALEVGVNIGFLFQRQAPFEAGLGALAAQDPPLAAYLEQARAQWSETLVNRRNAIEHEGWRLPDVTYVRADSGVGANAPLVDGQAIVPYATSMFDRLSCFVEEVTAHLLQRRLMDGVTIAEVPRDQRAREAPERFRVTVAIGGLTPWTIAYHGTPFEET